MNKLQREIEKGLLRKIRKEKDVIVKRNLIDSYCEFARAVCVMKDAKK